MNIAPATSAERRSNDMPVKAVMAATIGTAQKWFDFALYGRRILLLFTVALVAKCPKTRTNAVVDRGAWVRCVPRSHFCQRSLPAGCIGCN
jgi:transposase